MFIQKHAGLIIFGFLLFTDYQEPACCTDCKVPLGKFVMCDIGLYQIDLTCLDLTKLSSLQPPQGFTETLFLMLKMAVHC